MSQRPPLPPHDAPGATGRHRRPRPVSPTRRLADATLAGLTSARRTSSPGGGSHRAAPAQTPWRLGALPATLTVAALAAGAVGVLGSPAEGSGSEGGTTEASAAQQRDLTAQAVAQARELRATRDQARMRQLRGEAEAAGLLDKQLTSIQRDMALQAARAKARARARAAAAREAARPKWVLPVLNYRLTASFGQSSGLWSHRHTGQDFAAPTGTPIRAVGDGRIVFAGWDGPYGRRIAIRHADGTETWYCHMSAFIRTGGLVKAGQVIGRVGSTGNTTGPHLHLEVRPGGGSPIDPMPWLRAHGLAV